MNSHSTDNTSSALSSSDKGIIAGASLVSILLVAVLVTTFVHLQRKRRKAKMKKAPGNLSVPTKHCTCGIELSKNTSYIATRRRLNDYYTETSQDGSDNIYETVQGAYFLMLK